MLSLPREPFLTGGGRRMSLLGQACAARLATSRSKPGGGIRRARSPYLTCELEVVLFM
jgi:hypothetical protein